ncbi:MAG: alanine--tRNA ligase-related protein [Verrucomicrobiae bacterium]
MTSAQIRQSFLDFFRGKSHSLVPSSSLMPDSPNLLFTNAGMNQFVPIFLAQRVPDVSRWAGAVPGSDTRAADTQKCIRAGGKHNDLDDVGLDTYHHTFFEMLGNWSFGDYFKAEAISWAWELIVGQWKFPPQRLYATIYSPDPGDPAERDGEAWELWAEKFRSAGLDPAVHIVNGNKKDNFWMMGETGPCGPCSELHVDLTPAGDTRGALVNRGTAECIEIWNLVFIQFNANPGGTFSPLPAKHVDTGMGFERVCSIIQGTKGFTDFANAKISNYETDIFRPIFDEIEALSGKKYASTLPQPNAHGQIIPESEQEKTDVAFRVIADHIRTLSFAIADGIQPGNTDRNYVLRRILRRAVRYGRTLGFHEPFFYKLVGVLARTMGDVFPEIRKKQKHVGEVLQREEESFNKTLDKGIALFEAEATGISGRVGVPPAGSDILSEPTEIGATYTRRRRLPHFEKPWTIYAITFTTINRRVLSPDARSIVLDALLHFHDSRYELFGACVMPDHVHLLIQPWIKEQDERGESVFWSLGELMHSIKSFTAKAINKREGTVGSVWEQERFDRYVRGDRDLEEKFRYITENPWQAGLADGATDYPWVWTPDDGSARVGWASCPPDSASRRVPAKGSGKMPAPAGGTPTLPGAFAFRLYDEQGFPLDLTQLMARERGLSVDVAGFEKLMEEQRARARAAQKRQVIELSEVETKEATKFVGYDALSTPAKVLEVVRLKDKTAVVLDASAAYAEMGGQVGDTGEIAHGADFWRISNTQKTGHTWLHLLDADDAPEVGALVTLNVDPARRAAIQRHHTVTHLLHWALHEVVSHEATQKGSFVGPDKLTFDFNSSALTPAQVRDIERLVNGRIVENAGVSWVEMPYADVRGHAGIMQFFGDKYGESVRVVQIGGTAGSLDGYSMELCAGTHARATGEIGLFRILGEAAIAAGVRRIEAVAGLEASAQAERDAGRLVAIAAQLNSPAAEIEKKIETLLAHHKELEKSLKAARAREAAARAKDLAGRAETIAGIPFLAVDLGAVDGDFLQSVADALKGNFSGVCLLAGTANNTVALVASVSPEFTSRVQAGKLIQAAAPIVGGKGGGKPDAARGGGKDPSKLADALAQARALLQ